MANTPATFKQSDLTRAIKSFLQAGLDVGGAKIERDGTITILTTSGGTGGPSGPNPDELLQ